MAQYNPEQSTTTNLNNAVKDFSVNSESPDEADANNNENWWDYPDAHQNLGYYKKIPELKKAIDTLATWVVGKGVTASAQVKAILENWTGWGEDSYMSILWNLQVQKKVFGDAFAEIITNERGDIVNVKPLFPGNMRVKTNKKGIITGYEQRIKGLPKTKFQPSEILHLVNDRICNEIHGTNIIEACKWVIDARNEALIDERMIKHRELALGVLYVDSDKDSKISALITQYEKAIKNGEVLVLPKDIAELKDPGISPKERLQWIQYLENFFYQAVGVPKVVVNAQDFSEASSKMGITAFDPIYSREQQELESDLWNQLALRVKFNRPPQLHGLEEENEKRNVGQVGVQPSEFQATAGRVE